MTNDEHWMRHALAWSAMGRGWTSPRPSVGCVIVRDGQVLGGGHTQPGHGNPHAEVVALRAAREAGHDTRGATAYVTLEPCCHFATTPPCTGALIEAGIARVVCGVLDPNPAVNGCGFAQLREANIEVVPGVLEAECFRAQEDFLFHITRQIPFVTLKCAVSLDGNIALQNGESQWITGEAARERAHVLRHEHDAVLCGIETALHDNPRLDVRLAGRWKQPARIVLDSMARLPLDARLLQGKTPLYVVHSPSAPPHSCQALADAGAQLLEVPRDDGLCWQSLLPQLYARGVHSILIEGGARVAGSALKAGVVDKIVFFVAPVLLGEGKRALDGLHLERLSQAQRLRNVEVERIGDDVLISGYCRLP